MVYGEQGPLLGLPCVGYWEIIYFQVRFMQLGRQGVKYLHDPGILLGQLRSSGILA